jgi:uncharacterized MAPEG superfamily protein
MNYLFLSSILGLVHIGLSAAFSTKERGLQWNLSARDNVKPALTGVAGRLDRASSNFRETFPFFLAAILVGLIQNKQSAQLELGSQLYFFARVLYLPLYALGIPYIRSLAWFASIAGILMVLLAVV